MRLIVPLIWESVRVDVKNGETIDVDEYVARFLPMRTELGADLIRSIVVEAVAAVGGLSDPKSSRSSTS